MFGSQFGSQQWQQQQRWQQLQDQRRRAAGYYWQQQQRRQRGGTTPSGGSCFVATACFGDPDHPTVTAIRRFRDDVLRQHTPGRAFIAWYYRRGPGLARLLDRLPALKRPVRLVLAAFARACPGATPLGSGIDVVFRDFPSAPPGAVGSRQVPDPDGGDDGVGGWADR